MSVPVPIAPTNYAAIDAANLLIAQQNAQRLARAQSDAAAAQLRTQLAAQTTALPVGSTVTARLNYKVGPDGSLVPTQTQITTKDNGTATDQRRSNGSPRQQQEADSRALAKLAPVRAALAPTDELALFGQDNQVAQATISADGSQNLASGTAVDGQGSPVDVAIITPRADAPPQGSAQVLSLNARLQSSAAALYARNNDVAFNSVTLSQYAA